MPVRVPGSIFPCETERRPDCRTVAVANIYYKEASAKELRSMSFCLLPDESVEDGIKRIVSEEISQAIKEIDTPRLKRTEAIHEVRTLQENPRCAQTRETSSRTDLSVLKCVVSRYGQGACRSARRRSHNRDSG